MDAESIVQQREATEKLPSLELKEPLILQLKEKDECSEELKDKTKGSTASRDDRIYRRSHKLVYLVCGKDQGRDAWHYVLIDKRKEAAFKHVVQSGTIDVAKYGDVLYSGWGKDPPEDIVRKVEEEFSLQLTESV